MFPPRVPMVHHRDVRLQDFSLLELLGESSSCVDGLAEDETAGSTGVEPVDDFQRRRVEPDMLLKSYIRDEGR